MPDRAADDFEFIRKRREELKKLAEPVIYGNCPQCQEKQCECTGSCIICLQGE